MTRTELNDLFKQYLYRAPTEREWTVHGGKNYHVFEKEISECKERSEILRTDTKNVNVGKIAFLLTGHIRRNSILAGINSFCRKYDYDIFIHTWDNFGIKGKETNLDDRLNKFEIENEIKKIPNVKKYEIENNKKYIESLTQNKKYFNYSSPEPFIKSQLYSINKAFSYLENEVNENKTIYKAVFKLRFDSDMFLFNLNKAIVEDINNHDIIFVPNIDNHHIHPDNGTSCWACDNMYYEHKLKDVHVFEHTNVICDLFAYGSFNSMKKYCSLYDAYDSINEKYFKKNLETSKIHNKNLSIVNSEYKLVGGNGHLHSLYYYYCSYPERMLQLHLKDYMLVESKNIKLKLIR